MNAVLAKNIAKYRKNIGFTQEDLAQKLHISAQAVSKWETGQSQPDISLLPDLAFALDTDINSLMGYVYDRKKITIYEDEYQQEEYYWGLKPSFMCYRVLELLPPVRPLRLLDIGCGEGKDAVFFARNGYIVTGFDIADAGIEKTKRLAEKYNVHVNVIKANLLDFSTLGGIHMLNVFVDKPFIPSPPERETNAYKWISGELFTHYYDWNIQTCDEVIFDCNSSGIPHKHCMDIVIVEKPNVLCASK